MAIDPSIPMSVKPPQFDSPMQTLGQLMALKHGQSQQEALDLENKKRMTDLADEAQFTEALKMNNGDPDATIAYLNKHGASGAALKAEVSLLQLKTQRGLQTERDLKNTNDMLEMQANIIYGVHDQGSLDAVRATAGLIEKSHPDLEGKILAGLPETYTPEAIDRVIEAGSTYAQKNLAFYRSQTAANRAFELMTQRTKDRPAIVKAWTETLANKLGTARSQQEWDADIASARSLIGTSTDKDLADLQDEVIKQFPQTWSPDAVKAAVAMQMTAAQRENARIANIRESRLQKDMEWRHAHPQADPVLNQRMSEYRTEEAAYYRTHRTQSHVDSMNRTPSYDEKGKQLPALKADPDFPTFDEWQQKKYPQVATAPAAAAGAPARAAGAKAGTPAPPTSGGKNLPPEGQVSIRGLSVTLPASQGGITIDFPDRATMEKALAAKGYKMGPATGGGGAPAPAGAPAQFVPTPDESVDENGDPIDLLDPEANR